MIKIAIGIRFGEILLDFFPKGMSNNEIMIPSNKYLRLIFLRKYSNATYYFYSN